MDLDTLLTQALALVSEDRRGELADVIEQIIKTAQATPQKVYLLAVGDELTDIAGVYASVEALKTAAQRMGIRDADIGEFVVEKAEAANGQD